MYLKSFSDGDGFTVWGVKAVPHFRQNLSSGDISRPQLGILRNYLQ